MKTVSFNYQCDICDKKLTTEGEGTPNGWGSLSAAIGMATIAHLEICDACDTVLRIDGAFAKALAKSVKPLIKRYLKARQGVKDLERN